MLFKEVCGNHDRDFWYTNTEDAHKLGIDENSPICDPFKEELNPNAETLARLAALLNEMIHNRTKEGAPVSDAATNVNETAIAEDNKTLENLGDDATTISASTLLHEVTHSQMLEPADIPNEKYVLG